MATAELQALTLTPAWFRETVMWSLGECVCALCVPCVRPVCALCVPCVCPRAGMRALEGVWAQLS